MNILLLPSLPAGNMPSPSIQYLSPARRLGSPPIYKRPISKAEVLQLWVEHGARISTRSAVLLSRSVAAHAAAVSAQTESSFSHALSTSTVPAPFRTAAPAAVALATRRTLRNRRKHDVGMLKNKEQAEELRALQAEKERIALIREKQAREAERRQMERQAAEAKALELQAAERRVAERRVREAKERQEAVAISAAAEEQQARNENLNATNTGSSMESGTPAPAKKVVRFKDVESDAQKGGATPVQRKSQTNPNGFHWAILAEGNTTEVSRSGKIVEVDGIPEDVARIVTVWNKLCHEAEPFRRDASMKKPRVEMKKQVNLMVNQIAASIKQVSTKVANLLTVLKNAKAGGGAAGEAFAMKEVSQRLISESDGSVALNRTAAFAVGSVIVGISAGVQDPSKMRDVFLGAFYKHCVYTTPAYPRKHKGESTDDYRLRIGYKDGETPESYMERSCGCVSLFAAVLQTDKILGPAQRWQNVSNPFSLDIGWTWLARIANREQRAITPALTFAFLEIAGYCMSERYRLQFTKLIAMVQQAVVLKAVKSAPPGPTSRMDSLLEDFISAGCTFPKPPEGRELPAKDMEFL